MNFIPVRGNKNAITANGTVEFIFNKLVEMKNNGGAVLLINEDLDELMLLSDRIAVLHNGEIKKIFERKDFDKYRIGLIMVGG